MRESQNQAQNEDFSIHLESIGGGSCTKNVFFPQVLGQYRWGETAGQEPNCDVAMRLGTVPGQKRVMPDPQSTYLIF